jgi:hypothetical protein
VIVCKRSDRESFWQFYIWAGKMLCLDLDRDVCVWISRHMQSNFCGKQQKKRERDFFYFVHVHDKVFLSLTPSFICVLSKFASEKHKFFIAHAWFTTIALNYRMFLCIMKKYIKGRQKGHEKDTEINWEWDSKCSKKW